MKKILILAYDFPPYVSVGGLRPYSWYKYLHLFDIHPIVITRQWSNKFGNHLDYISPGYSDSIDEEINPEGTVLKTPFNPTLSNKIALRYGENKFRLFRKVITAYYELLQFVLPVGGKQGIYDGADEFLKHNKVDCIIATGGPFILFKYASKLSTKYSIPWIADYRDPWIQDNSLKEKFYKPYFSRIERSILKNVSKIITVQTFFQKQIESNITGKEFEIVYNGYDPEILKLTDKVKQDSETLSIAFAGTIKDWDPVESFLNICNELVTENKEFKVNLYFYGINKEKEIKEFLAKKYPLLQSTTYFSPRLENLELSKSISRQNVFLLFNYFSIIGTKIYDYLALKRKIILCYDNDQEHGRLKLSGYVDNIETETSRAQAELISATNSGIVVKDANHLKEVLLDLHDEFKKKGFIDCLSDDIKEYSRVRQAERLAEIVKELTKS